MQTLALDLGSHTLRTGLAGQDQPRNVESSAVGVFSGDFVYPCNFGSRRIKTHVVDVYHDAIFDVKRKTIDNAYLDFALDTALFPPNGNVNRHSTPVVFSFPLFGDRKLDKKVSTKKYVNSLVSSLFEYCEVPAVFARPDPVLAAFSCGRTSAIVADFGSMQSSVAQVSDGAVSQFSSWKFGGAEIDALVLKRLTAENGGRFPSFYELNEVDESFLRRSQLHVIQEMKQNIFRVAPSTLSPPPERMRAAKKHGNTVMYKLPDGTEIDVATVYEYIPELYFNQRLMEKFHVPDFPGVSQALTPYFPSGDVDGLFGESPERDRTQPLVLCGGIAQMTGFQARVQAELPRNVPLVCPAMFGRPYASWTGVSVLGSLAACAGNLAISSKEYLDQGIERVVDLLITS